MKLVRARRHRDAIVQTERVYDASYMSDDAYTGVGKWLPGLQMVRGYRWVYVRSDVQAGLILTALLVPAGMAYAVASGLPPIYGLYATLVPLIAYALFGPSRILVLGPDSSLSPLIAAALLPLAAGDPARAVALAGALGILVGLILMATGLARLGFITELLSKPVRYGFINGIALTVLVSQVPSVLGFSVGSTALAGRIVEMAHGVAAGFTNRTSFALGVGSLALILVLRQWVPRVPGILVAVILATVAVSMFGLTEQSVSVVGRVPRGLPGFVLPSLRWSDMGLLLGSAAGIALVAFADTSVLSRTFAARAGARAGYKVDPNREMVALGIANAVTGLFQGFPISSSASRTPVAESAGAKTQVTGLVGAAAVAGLLVFAPALLTDLPTAALGAVVIAAAIALAEVSGVRRLFQERPSEFWLSMVAFLSVALLGVLMGIAIAVGLSLLNFIRLAWWPHDALLGRAPGVKGYHDIGRYGSAEQVPGLILYRFDAPLFFANAHLFGEKVRRLVSEAEPPARWVVVAAEPITDVDTTAADVVEELAAELRVAGVELAFAELKDPVKDHLERYGLMDRLGRGRFFPTVGVAVKAYVRETGVGWTDWEDAAG